MAKNNKYQINIQQVESAWQAQIIRQVTSKKTKVTKEQGDFKTEADANEWADNELKQLLATLANSNQRHDKNRKQNAEIAQQRSSRRAEKIALAKAEKVKKDDLKNLDQANDEIDGIDPEVDYDFDEFIEKE